MNRVRAQPVAGARLVVGHQRDRRNARGLGHAEGAREPTVEPPDRDSPCIAARNPALRPGQSQRAHRRGRVGRKQEIGDDEIEGHKEKMVSETNYAGFIA